MAGTRPKISEKQIIDVLEKRNMWYTTEIKRLPSFDDTNFLIVYGSAEGELSRDSSVIVKVIHARNFDEGKLIFERKTMSYLRGEGFVCTQCRPFHDGQWFITQDQPEDYIIRLYSYIPGVTLSSCLPQVDIATVIREVGVFVGQLHKSLENGPVDFNQGAQDSWYLHNAGQMVEMVKDLEFSVIWWHPVLMGGGEHPDIMYPGRDYQPSSSKLANFLTECQDESKESLILQVLDNFETEVMANYSCLKKGIIHNDIHDMNIIVNFKDGNLQPLFGIEFTDEIKSKYGLIDFGDLTYSALVFDIAKVIRDFMAFVEGIDTMSVGGLFLSGYLKVIDLSNDIDKLPICVKTALCQYIVLGEDEFKKQPDNEYTKLGEEGAWRELQKIKTIENEKMLQHWRGIIEK